MSALFSSGHRPGLGEEAALLATQRAFIEAGIDCRLLLVPRHAERASEIVRMLQGQALSWHQRSSGATPANGLQIHLADTTGELATLLQAADLAFVGKSLPPNKGGQTPIEAAGTGHSGADRAGNEKLQGGGSRAAAQWSGSHGERSRRFIHSIA